ncbi:EthD domain-containing protein [Xylariaceae sp. AK1471]|nr:EthD domain-containing protein [Xylariaceae sp. AK1471]
MTYSILVFLSRKAGTTPKQFQDYYAGSHMPMFRELAGSHFPILHTQRYIHRTDASGDGNTQRNSSTPASVFAGRQADFDFDVVVDLKFQDAAAFEAFMQHIHQPEIWSKVVADEEKFLDRNQTRVALLGDIIEMTAH